MASKGPVVAVGTAVPLRPNSDRRLVRGLGLVVVVGGGTVVVPNIRPPMPSMRLGAFVVVVAAAAAVVVFVVVGAAVVVVVGLNNPKNRSLSEAGRARAP